MHRAAVARSYDANIVPRTGLIAHPMSYLERIVVLPLTARVSRYHYLLSLTRHRALVLVQPVCVPRWLTYLSVINEGY
jgi:hypothetical protein